MGSRGTDTTATAPRPQHFTQLTDQADSALWVIDVASVGAPRKIYDGDAVQPAWSPNGQRIAFWAATRGQRDVGTISATGGAAVAVTQDAMFDWGSTWSPDGRFLYFASDRGGAMNLWRVAVDQSTGVPRGSPEPVTHGVQVSIGLPDFSRDGTKLVFRSAAQAVNPVAIPFDPASERLGSPKLLFRRIAILAPSDVSRDGALLALVNIGERQEDIFICRTDGSDLVRVTDDAARDRQPVWSPDGKQLAFYSSRSGRYQVWIIGRDGGGLRQVSDVKDDELFFPLYSPSGDRMVGSANKSDRPMYMFDPSQAWADQQITVLPLQMPARSSFAALSWSPDGRRLAGRVMNAAGTATGLTIYDVETRALRTVGSKPRDFPTSWLPDSRRVIIMNAEGELTLYDADSGRERQLTMPSGVRLSSIAIAISPDGRTIYAAALERESDVWMMEVKER